jgi:hypothetical protein
MITSGRNEFSSRIWPLVATMDDQIYLAALRSADRFLPSVLGVDARERLAALPDEVREHVLSEIAMRSRVEGMELAAEIAKGDPNPRVQFAVVESLLFRRADQLVRDVLKSSDPSVWTQLAQKGYGGEIADPEMTEKLRQREVSLIDSEVDPLRRLSLLVRLEDETSEIGAKIAEIIKSATFPVKAQHAGQILSDAIARYPVETGAALVDRLANGHEIPFRGEELLANVATIDEGLVAAAATNLDGSKGVAEAAVTIVGPKTIGALIDKLRALQKEAESSGRKWDQTQSDLNYRLTNMIARTRLAPERVPSRRHRVARLLDRCTCILSDEVAYVRRIDIANGVRSTDPISCNQIAFDVHVPQPPPAKSRFCCSNRGATAWGRGSAPFIRLPPSRPPRRRTPAGKSSSSFHPQSLLHPCGSIPSASARPRSGESLSWCLSNPGQGSSMGCWRILLHSLRCGSIAPSASTVYPPALPCDRRPCRWRHARDRRYLPS